MIVVFEKCVEGKLCICIYLLFEWFHMFIVGIPIIIVLQHMSLTLWMNMLWYTQSPISFWMVPMYHKDVSPWPWNFDSPWIHLELTKTNIKMQDNISRIFKYKLLTSWQLGALHKNVGIKASPNCIFTHRLELRIYNIYFYSNDIYPSLKKKK
jgi:hypothetical protein